MYTPIYRGSIMGLYIASMDGYITFIAHTSMYVYIYIYFCRLHRGSRLGLRRA